MHLKAMFPSKYLSAADLNGQDVTVQIEKIEMELLKVQNGPDEEKPAITFKGKKKQLILNNTNANAIADVLGSEETEDWVGKSITLYSARVQFGPKMVDAIRVRTDRAAPPKRQAPPPNPEDDGREPFEVEGGSDDIPF